MSKHSDELTEDIEVVGPGQMLAEARVKLGLSQKEVADKLNFRMTLVNDIEQEIFDQSLPDTFNRGYLKNYAKLVGITEQDIIASYEMLGVAVQQRTEMQSFSKATEKEAQNSRLMWLSYFIFAGLVASTVFYYWQDAGLNASTGSPSASPEAQTLENKSELSVQQQVPSDVTPSTENDESSEGLSFSGPKTAQQNTASSTASELNASEMEELEQTVNQSIETELVNTALEHEPESLDGAAQNQTLVEASAIFTFAGDCWVNIYDGDGERIAWGIKKSGYVMELKGKAPFKVTVGKPELVSIDYNGQPVDMSKFNIGNIAKFTLPELSE
ncbi:RodZ domain-containing protein [Colwellia sp. MEBiC06753]